ncbi:hypothetical protein [Reyranella sp.]|uniref:hypothetical protein n=1 Tax=Reyranella sp. TaxID=1929291 RepID=UPI0037849731
MTTPYLARRYRSGRLKIRKPFPLDADGVPMGVKEADVLPKLPRLRSAKGLKDAKPYVDARRIKRRVRGLECAVST